MKNDIISLPKVELHLHLDGSLRVETVYEILREKVGSKCPSLDKIKAQLTVNKGCKNLNEYLEKFTLPVMVMQTPEQLERVAYELVCDLAKENIIYSEIRFAPSKHTEEGLTQDKVVEAVLKGLRRGESENNIKTNLILCCMRGGKKSENIETIKTAKRHLDKGVCSLDLAGAEALFPTKDYKEMFLKAKELGVPFTIHAGEADGPESIYDALSMGTKRIGHGIRCIESNELMNKIKEEGITLEACPTSNVQTQAVLDIKEHPINKLLKEGIKVTVSRDNGTVSGITLIEELETLQKTFGININQICQMQINAIEAAFITEKEKKNIKAKIDKWMELR